MVVVLGHCHSGKLLSAAFITVMLSDLFVSDAFHLVRTVTQWTIHHSIARFWNEKVWNAVLYAVVHGIVIEVLSIHYLI